VRLFPFCNFFSLRIGCFATIWRGMPQGQFTSLDHSPSRRSWAVAFFWLIALMHDEALKPIQRTMLPPPPSLHFLSRLHPTDLRLSCLFPFLGVCLWMLRMMSTSVWTSFSLHLFASSGQRISRLWPSRVIILSTTQEDNLLITHHEARSLPSFLSLPNRELSLSRATAR